MSKLGEMIAAVEANELLIEELMAVAEPHLSDQREFSAAAKEARGNARNCQIAADEFLVPAQKLRETNQRLKIEAGQIALNEQRSA